MRAAKRGIDAVGVAFALTQFLRQTRSKTSASQYVIHYERRIEVLISLGQRGITNTDNGLFRIGYIVEINLRFSWRFRSFITGYLNRFALPLAFQRFQ